MQRTTMVAIAAALGLGLGAGAGFLKAQSPSTFSGTADVEESPSLSADPQSFPSPSLPLAEDGAPSKPDHDAEASPRSGRTRQSDDVQSPSEPSPLKFDAQATHCPSDGGGGPLVSLFMTDHHLVYICQGGEGREDWRELDYYAVNRSQPDDWIRLRAFVTSGPGVYAENGAYRYEIDPNSLTVQENGSILLQEPVLRCKGNCS